MSIYKSLPELIGNTPLLHLQKFQEAQEAAGNIIAKLEYFNPGGSVKDRIAKAMIEDAEKSGKLKPGAVIIESTSGNTGIGLASVGSAKGYKVILTMPESMSLERRNLLKALGAELVLTPASGGMKAAIAKADELAEELDNAFIPWQFDNPANPAIHYKTTGPEIYSATEGKVDVLVSGIGTGGTISGTGKYLKEQNPDIKVIAVEPKGSAVLSGQGPGPHKIQGIGAGFIPNNLDTEIYDEIVTVDNDEAYAASRQAARSEGLLVGISSGAALHAATLIAKRPEYAGKNIVVILPDTGERYLSTPLYQAD